MLALTEFLGAPVVDHEGERIGDLRDLRVRIHPRWPPVTAIVAHRRRQQPRLISWASVTSFEQDRVTVDGGEPATQTTERGHLLVARDLLDAQIVDLAGHKLVRVGDVQLERTAQGLVLAGVDVGSGAVLRRLGLRRLARRRPAEILDWGEIHIASPRGHAVLLEAERGLERRSTDQIAAMVARTSPPRGAEVLHSVGPARAAAAMRATPAPAGAAALRHMEHAQRERVLAQMPQESAATLRELVSKPHELRRRRRSRFGKVLSVRRHAPS